MKNTYYTPVCFGFNTTRELFGNPAISLAKRNGDVSTEWMPRVDLSENEKSYSIQVDLPGIDKKHIEVTYQDGTLTLSGKRERAETDSGDALLGERFFGKFQRSFKFDDDINSQAITAHYQDGVLTITAAKSESRQPVKVSVA